MDSNIEGRFSKPIVSPSNPIRDDLALLGPIRLAGGPVDPMHSLHYYEYTESSPNEKGDSLQITRHGNTVARWWAHQKLHPTDDNDGDDSDSEASWDNLSHSLESPTGQVSPEWNFRYRSVSCISPMKSCLKGSSLTLPTNSTASLTTPGCSPTAKKSGRRVMFNEVVTESIIAETPIIITDVHQAPSAAAADTNDVMGLGDDWARIPAPSTLGLDLGPEGIRSPLDTSSSLIAGTSGNAQLTIKAVIPLYPVALYPPPQGEEVGITVKFVPPVGMTSLISEDLLPSDRALRAEADGQLADAIDRLYARHHRGFMVEAVSAGGYGSGGGEGDCLFGEGGGMIREKKRGRGREPKVLLGDGVKPSMPATGGQAECTERQDTDNGNGKTDGVKGKTGKGDGGKEGLVKHKRSKSMLARMIGVMKGWIWRSG